MIWTDEDIAFDKELNTTEDQPTGESLFIVQRLFYNFTEEWENELQYKKKDPVAKAKFEQKYKGVMFRDAPTETFVCVGVTYREGRGCGWCLDVEEISSPGVQAEPFPLGLARACLQDATKQVEMPRASGIKFVTKEEVDAANQAAEEDAEDAGAGVSSQRSDDLSP